MEEREGAEDLAKDEGLPQPGTREPDDAESSDSTEGPGNVSVDEPTAGALEAEELDEQDDFQG